MLPSSALRPTLSAVLGVLARSRAKKYSYWTGTTRCLTFAAPLAAFPCAEPQNNIAGALPLKRVAT